MSRGPYPHGAVSSSKENRRVPAARLTVLQVGRGETDSAEEGFLTELILRLDLEGLTILRRKTILETEKSPMTERHRCVNQVRYQTTDGGVAGRARGSSNSIQNGISSPPGGRD